MKIKRSELNNLILEVTQNNQISKNIAFIIDKQGVDIDEAVTIYIKDNPSATEASVTQALTDFPISNSMDKAFVAESIDEVIDAVIKEVEDEEEDDLDPVVGAMEDPVADEEPIEDIEGEESIEEPEEEVAIAGEETAEDLYGGEQKYNPDVQRALSIISQVVKEPREYFALMNGQVTPDGKPKFPGVMHMVVMNPREKRRAMRVILGKRLGDLTMDYLEKPEATDNAYMSEQLNELEVGSMPEPTDDTPEAGENEVGSERDVEVMLKTLPRINKSSEYSQLLGAILKHGLSGRVPQITKEKLYRALINYLKSMKKTQGN